MKRPHQNELAAQVRSKLQGKVFWRGIKRGGHWYYWNEHRQEWLILPPTELQRAIQEHFDQVESLTDSGYTFGLVSSVEKLLRARLTYHGQFFTAESKNPNLLARVGVEAKP